MATALENSFFTDFIGPFPDVLWEPRLLSPTEERELLQFCLTSVGWREMSMYFGGRDVPVPRRLAWFGDTSYTYSGLKHPAEPMPLPLAQLALRLEAYLKNRGAPTRLNSVLLNHYRSGADSIGMHSDDESQLEENSVIASVSLGDARTFVFEHKKTGLRHANLLTGGSLLVMKGDCQREWRHGIFKETGPSNRVNLTFRWTRPLDAG